MPAGAPVFGAWGVDLSARDLSVKPGDDFQRHATGAWMDAHPIPANMASLSVGAGVAQQTRVDIAALIAAAPADSHFGILYRSYCDEAAVEAAGDAALRADLARIEAIADAEGFARAMGAALGGFGAAVAALSVEPDPADPARHVLSVTQSGLGLPERDYYLDDGFAAQREAYRAFAERVFTALGHADPAGDAGAVCAFETAIARASWSAADCRDVVKTDNPMSSAELAAYAPGIAWEALLAGAGIEPLDRLIIENNSASRAIAALVGATSLETLKLWLRFRTAADAAPYLGKAWVDSRFAFDATLSGVSAPPPRAQRGIELLNDLVGDDVGRAYVAAHFPHAAKVRLEALVATLKAAMAERIAGSTWLSAPARAVALDKLAKMEVMVGYPDRFRDYAALRLAPGDLYGNIARARAFGFACDRADLDRPVDRRAWEANAQEVDAYNAPQENKVVFPAGILQPPFFDPAADEAVNYGAIGAIIGHEISHGFDDQGRKFDSRGAMRDWWSDADDAGFASRTEALGAQYAKFEAAPGVFIDPALTMGENIADCVGLEVALAAYHHALGDRPAPVIDGLTGDQRFFLAFAQAWRGVIRDDAVRRQVATDPHCPRRFRLLGPIRNMDEWYAAFGVAEGDALYLGEGQRVRVW